MLSFPALVSLASAFLLSFLDSPVSPQAFPISFALALSLAFNMVSLFNSGSTVNPNYSLMLNKGQLRDFFVVIFCERSLILASRENYNKGL